MDPEATQIAAEHARWQTEHGLWRRDLAAWRADHQRIAADNEVAALVAAFEHEAELYERTLASHENEICAHQIVIGEDDWAGNAPVRRQCQELHSDWRTRHDDEGRRHSRLRQLHQKITERNPG